MIVLSVMLCLIVILSINILPFKKIFLSSRYHVFTSPDKSYRVELFAYQQVLPAMPGSSAGDETGYIRLYNKDNHLLNEKEIEMVQLVETVDWSDDRVSIKLIADWELETLGNSLEKHLIN